MSIIIKKMPSDRIATTIVVTNDGNYYYVDTAITRDRGYETMAFPCDENGYVHTFDESMVNWDKSISHEYICLHLEEFIKKEKK